MTVTVTCEVCGHKHPRTETGHAPGETFFMVCHVCEAVLRLDVPPDASPVPPPPPAAVPSAFSSIVR